MIRKFLYSVAAVSLAVASLAASSPAMAWGQTGHRVSGEIAEANINGRTRAQIEAIMGHEGLPEASTVPDEQRSNPAPFWQDEAGPYHYVTLPEGMIAQQLEHPPEGDAATALDRFTAVLRDDDASQEDKQLALRFIVHLVSDLHMPLHVGNGTDRGGNDVMVNWFGDRTNLHAVWDSRMINGQTLSYTEYTARLQQRITAGDVIDWWDADPVTWMNESAGLRDQLYPALNADAGMGTRDNPVSLGYGYQWRWLPTAERRLAQSGIRLAAYLDWVFAEEG